MEGTKMIILKVTILRSIHRSLKVIIIIAFLFKEITRIYIYVYINT